MNPLEIRCGAREAVSLEPIADDIPLHTGPVELQPGDQPAEYRVIQGSRLVTMRATGLRKTGSLDDMLRSGRGRLAMVDGVADGGVVHVTVHLFNGAAIPMGDLQIGIDDDFCTKARVQLQSHLSNRDLAQELRERFSLPLQASDGSCAFLITTGRAAVADLEREGDRSHSGAAPTSFCLQGDGIRIAVEHQRNGDLLGRLVATRISRSTSGTSDAAIRLARGSLTFTDSSHTAEVRELALLAMSRLAEASNGYLKTWDSYGQEEGRLLLARARSVGVLRWSSVPQQVRGQVGVEFHFSESLPDCLAIGDELELVLEPPSYLLDPELDWDEYLEDEALEKRAVAEQNRDTAHAQPLSEEEAAESGVVGKILKLSDQSLVLGLSASPPASLSLVLSLAGERVQIERRREARRLVQECRSANPHLGAIIEDAGEPPLGVPRREKLALSEFVRRKVFPRNPPTPAQLKAISVALNTPDIALIQGPPGTGKTTVIAAIVEQLNELSDKNKPILGEVLVSAFQHDAIENMMARLNVNSIPVPKFGRRSGSSDLEGRGAGELRQWCEQLAVSVRKKNPGLSVQERHLGLEKLSRQYILAPSLENAIATIDAFSSTTNARFAPSLHEKAAVLRAALVEDRKGRDVAEDTQTLRALWGLRTTSEGFADDGAEAALQLLAHIDKQLAPAELALLEKAATCNGEPSAPFLGELRQLKATLIERYRPRPAFRIDKPRHDVVQFIDAALGSIRSPDGLSNRERILAEFLNEIESNAAAAQRAVEDYAFVFAATCQQSRGKSIVRRKQRGRGMRDAAAQYDTVIIDEAARCSPRDLLIPMAQARKRIILVGDHRQLPHLVNEEIVRALESASDSGSTDSPAEMEAHHVRKSLFQHLVTRLEQLERRDKLPRFVTLDQQFRMHPVLGEFVSRHFYEVHGPREAFTSPTGPEEYLHRLPDIPEVPAVWLNVPAARGRAMPGNKSWSRRAEAQEIAKRLASWIDLPEAKQLSFGVISFYKPQVDEIYEQLAGHDMTERDSSGAWRVTDAYQYLPAKAGVSSEERLRIGTVDSFQGMEFDVVFLSMVRSQPQVPRVPGHGVERAELARSVYGHLGSPNRLCVSMSRQRRVLVLVGDRAMIEHDLAAHAVPGLVAYLNLCKEHGWIGP